MAYHLPRLLIIPGLNDSGPAHWQSWLQRQHRDARRVVQRDFSTPDLARWAERIHSTVQSAGEGPWLAVAHSFGVLALARYLADHGGNAVQQALLVAPADPDRFGLAELLPQGRLPITTQLIASTNDPWMDAATALRWARRWGAHHRNLGAVGHINAESGFGPLPLAQRWVEWHRARAAAEQRFNLETAVGPARGTAEAGPGQGVTTKWANAHEKEQHRPGPEAADQREGSGGHRSNARSKRRKVLNARGARGAASGQLRFLG